MVAEMAFEILQSWYENEWWQLPEYSTAQRGAWDKAKRRAQRTLDRQHKGRLWNLECDNNTSIWDYAEQEQLENHHNQAAHACLSITGA